MKRKQKINKPNISSSPITSTNDDHKLYVEYKHEIDKRILSNSENHDKAILTYAGLGLTISLTFIKDIVPIESITEVHFLFISWLCFIVSIISVVVSFYISQLGLKKNLRIAEEYYINNNLDAYSRKNIADIFTTIINYISVASFIVAICLSAYFCYINFSQRIEIMTEKKEYQNGLNAPELIKKGANAPTLVPKPSQTTNNDTKDKK